MLSKLLQQNLVVPEVALHALLMHQRPQIPSEHQPVESRDHASNLALVFRDKLLHGVFLPFVMFSFRTTNHHTGTETPSVFGCGYAALCTSTGTFIMWTLYRLRVGLIAASMNTRLGERMAERERIAREL